MSNFDKDRYQSLISRCAVDFSFYKGTYQDLGPKRLATTAVGTPGWVMLNGLPCLSQSAAADGATSAAVAAIVDVTGALTVEWCGKPRIAGVGTNTLLAQVGATGGFALRWDCTNSVFVLALYNNAGVLARSITTPAASAVLNRTTHLVITSATGGTVGTAMINGVQVAATLGGAGVAANIGANSAVVVGGGVGFASTVLARAGTTAYDNADKTCVYGAAKSLVGEI